MKTRGKKKKSNPKYDRVYSKCPGSKGTYIARLKNIDISTSELLDKYSEVMNDAYRYAFARIQDNEALNPLKSQCIKKFGISGRHYNSNLSKIKSRIEATKTTRETKIQSLQGKIKSQEEYLDKLKDPKKRWLKQRYINRLKDKLNRLVKDAENEKVPITFGTNKLFRKQFNLQANGYEDLAAWKKDWISARNQSFMIIGSKEESSGNQLCNAVINENRNIDLRLRLPDALVKNNNKYLVIQDIKFNYGQEHIKASIVANQERKAKEKKEKPLLIQALANIKDKKEREIRKKSLLEEKKVTYLQLGSSISYVFKKVFKKGKPKWQVHVTVGVPQPKEWYSRDCGAIGVDINIDHLAITETDRFGNSVAYRTIALCTYGLSRHQSLALIGEVAKELVAYAKAAGKPIVLEKLSFKDKRNLLYKMDAKTARMLSSFSYSAIINFVKARAFREGIHCYQVNPAHTSLIGRFNYAERLGITIHQAAALVIARRFLGFSEKPLKPIGNSFRVPVGDGDHVTLVVPEQDLVSAGNRRRHVWSLWRVFNRELKPALAEHFRTKRKLRPGRSCLPEDSKKSLDRRSSNVVGNPSNFVGESPTGESLPITVGAASTQMVSSDELGVVIEKCGQG